MKNIQTIRQLLIILSIFSASLMNFPISGIIIFGCILSISAILLTLYTEQKNLKG